MASKESQGLQVALILFVMITIALAVTTYVYYRKSEEKIQEAIAAREESARQQRAAEITDFENQYLKHMIGFKPLDSAALEAIKPRMTEEFKGFEAQYERDMALFDAGFQEKNYQKLPKYLVDAIRDRNNTVSTLTDTQKAHETELATVQKREEDRAVTAEDALNKEQQDKKALETAFAADRQRHTDDLDKVRKTTDSQLVSIRKQYDSVKSEKDELDKVVEDKVRVIETQKEEIAGMREQTFEVADGYIVRLLPNGICWISLGLADGLKRQTTFSVYDQDDYAAKKYQPFGQAEADAAPPVASKGSLEVIDVIDQHLAECRILENSSRAPILPGDVIFSPKWKAGRRLHFGLAGFIDINGDGRSDRDIVRNLITMDGGIVDGEVHDDGTVTGAITVGTRFVIVGDAPIGAPGDNQNTSGQAMRAYTTMVDKARDLGVPLMGVDQFLDLMGWKGDVKTIPLGTAADPEDFKVKASDGTTRGSGSVFRPRTPTRGTSGAYNK